MYILAALIVLAVIAVVVVSVRRGEWRSHLTPLASLAFAFILAGILFSGSRFIGYGLMAVGVLLAVADILNRKKTPGKGTSRSSEGGIHDPNGDR